MLLATCLLWTAAVLVSTCLVSSYPSYLVSQQLLWCMFTLSCLTCWQTKMLAS